MIDRARTDFFVTCSGSGPSSCNQCAILGTAGPTDEFCDGLVRANGEGFLSCQSNADCEPANIGVDAGDCTLSKQRDCFLPTIEAQGTASTSQPTIAGVACIAPSANAGVNSVDGLPGPLRLHLEAETVFRCAGDPAFTYPGCP